MIQDLHVLPKLRDSLSYLYIEKSIVERDNHAIVILQGKERTSVPISALTVLMLGPGTSITQAAMNVIAENGCMVVWCGEGAMKFYGYGMGETKSSERLLKQAEWLMDSEKHMLVVRRMYQLRFGNISIENMTLEQIRGMEGVRVRETYKLYASKFHVKWNGRNYKNSDWDETDDLNKALSVANACLYSLCNAAIVSLGYSTGLGFVHTGKMLSFVYDIGDLYKAQVTIPSAFEAVSMSRTEPIEQITRRICRRRLHEQKILKRIADDLNVLFDESTEDEPNKKLPCGLWNDSGTVSGGTNYAGRVENGSNGNGTSS